MSKIKLIKNEIEKLLTDDEDINALQGLPLNDKNALELVRRAIVNSSNNTIRHVLAIFDKH